MRKTSRVLITVFALLFASLLLVFPAFAQTKQTKDLTQIGASKTGIPPKTKLFVKALSVGEGGTPCPPDPTDSSPVRNSSQNSQTFGSAAVDTIMNHMICAGGGCGCTRSGVVFLGTPPKGEELAYYQGGALGSLADMTGAIAQVPIHTADFIADVRESFSHPFVSPVYAQGLGFSSLRPILGLWKLFRNLAYFFFVIIFLVIGFMIMFRSKLGGQAAVTMQQALPKVVISLLLVTFSYAIAGLMIDLMYLIIYMMIGLFSGLGDGLSVSDLTTMAFSNHIITNVWALISGGSINTIADQLGGAVGSALSDAGWGGIGGVAGFGAGIVFLLVMIVATLVNMFRIFFALLMAYVTLIFTVVFAPIQLLLGAIPGQNTFGAWIKSLWENLLVFPVVIFFFFCAKYFSGPDAFGTGNVGFAPPQLGFQQGASANFVKAIIQFAILALIPKAVEIAKQLASGKLNVDVGKAMGEFYKQGKRGMTLPIDVGAGAAIGAIGANRLTKGKSYQGAATVAGLLGGAVGGGLTGLPTKLGGRIVGDVGRLGSETITRLGLQGAQERIDRRQAQIDAERGKKAGKAAGAPPTKPNATPTYGNRAGRNSFKDKWQ